MEGEPNLLAYLVLILTPLVSIVLVGAIRPQISVPLVIVAGQMFLPPLAWLKTPLIHADKDLLPALGALIGCLIFRRRSLKGAKPGRGLDLFIWLQVIGLFGTALTNTDIIPVGPKELPAMKLKDFLNASVNAALYWWPPLYLGRALYRTSRDLKDLFVVMAVACVVYSPFIFIEKWMSPQLNFWIYGFRQSMFLQTMKDGGFRPMVFMRHGLNVALFVLMGLLSATALAKAKQQILGFPAKAVVLYLVILLVLCKSLGAQLYALAVLPIIWFAATKTQARLATVLAVILFSYPVVRATGLIPVDSVNNLTLQMFGQERSSSLATRLTEEAWVMERALKRIVFGWGGYARPFRHDPWHGDLAGNIDGLWAITIGSQGVIGYVSIFAMLLVPAWRARKTLALYSAPRDRTLLGCLALMTVIYVADLIPNSSKDPYLTFLVGVLMGAARGPEPVYAVEDQEVPVDPRTMPYGAPGQGGGGGYPGYRPG